jgi:hypothetical protein
MNRTSIETEIVTLNDIPTQSVNLVTFEPNRLHVVVVGSVLPIFNEQKPMNETSKEDWALYHLKYEEYSKSLEHYRDINNNQYNFNKKMDKFLKDCKARLIAITSANNTEDRDKIEILLTKYLATVVYVYNKNKNSEYNINHLTNDELSNPFPGKLDELKSEMRTNGQNIINSINELKDEINNVNRSISNFQESLRFVIDRIEIESKGSYPIEYPSYKRRFKSYFHLHRNSVST